MQYISYDEYQQIEGTLDLTAFNRNIVRVCGVIDTATHKRIEGMAKVPEEVIYLCRDLVEYFANTISHEKIVTSRSQSAGPVSESESYAVKSKEDMQDDIDDMVYDYLMSVSDDKGTPLLYRGCACD